MSAPRPVMPGSTSPCTAHVAIAASMALPPALRIRKPASAASGWPAATIPCCATIVGRQLPDVGCGACGLSCARMTPTDAIVAMTTTVPARVMLTSRRNQRTALSVISRARSMIAKPSWSSASVMHSGGLVKNVFHRTNV